VAYNLVLEDGDLGRAKQVAKSIRSHSVRALGLEVGSDVQVSCNLVEPWIFGPAACYDAVAALSAVRSAELVGLVPAELLEGIDPSRYAQLDVAPERTIESRLERLSRSGLR
jgi:glutamate formiminotransferase